MRNLLILIDGLGYDQIEYFQPTGLSMLGGEGGLVPVRTMLAYSAGIYTGIWCGGEPDETGLWTEFRRRPRPPAFGERLLAALPGGYLPRAAQYVVHASAQRVGIRTLETFGIPPGLQSQFQRTSADYSVFPPFATAPPVGLTVLPFGIRSDWKYVQCPSIRNLPEAGFQELGTGMDTLMVALVELDHYGHAFGPFNPRLGECLRDLDDRLGAQIRSVQAAWPEVRVAVFSDHGMTPVARGFDLAGYLARRGFRLGKDYITFLHATLACLWFAGGDPNPVCSALSESGAGRILDREERRRLHLAFPDTEFGEAFFLADAGIELLPNFLSIARFPERGMHGYHPDISSTRAFLIGGGEPDRAMTIPDLHDALVGITNPLEKPQRTGEGYR